MPPMTSTDLLAGQADRRTAADAVFDELHRRIAALELRPNDRISEAEIAAEFGVSRQPVRDAFSRLGNLGYLVIRPQRATQVNRFSLNGIRNARFIRLAVEVEVARTLAAAGVAPAALGKLQRIVERQDQAVARSDATGFHRLDNEFHQTLCRMAGQERAIETVFAMKAQVDRLCLLSLRHANEMSVLLSDHDRIFAAITSGSSERTDRAVRAHLGRLDRTIEEVRELHPDYFDV